MTDWVSVRDRLPIEKGVYLVYAPTYTGGSSSGLDCIDGIMFSRFKTGKWSIETGYYKRPNCVTHWMPLPKPPKKLPPFTDYRFVSRKYWDSFFAANENSREGEYEPIGSYILLGDDGRYTGMDNSHGCAWVEEFDTLDECLKWLKNEDIDDDGRE